MRIKLRWSNELFFLWESRKWEESDFFPWLDLDRRERWWNVFAWLGWEWIQTIEEFQKRIDELLSETLARLNKKTDGNVLENLVDLEIIAFKPKARLACIRKEDGSVSDEGNNIYWSTNRRDKKV